MPTMNNGGPFLWGSACGSSPGGAIQPGNEFVVAGFAASVSDGLPPFRKREAREQACHRCYQRCI